MHSDGRQAILGVRRVAMRRVRRPVGVDARQLRLGRRAAEVQLDLARLVLGHRTLTL
jgi:hypothetical protein